MAISHFKFSEYLHQHDNYTSITNDFSTMTDNNCNNNIINPKRIKLSNSKFYNSHIEVLDDYCLLEIFSYLSISDIINVEKVCERWKILCGESWKIVKILDCSETTWFFSRQHNDDQRHEVTCINDLMKILKKCYEFISHFCLTCNCPTIFTNLLITVTKLCKNLQDVVITKKNFLSVFEISTLTDNCKNIEKLTIAVINKDCEEELSKLLNNNKKLKYFSSYEGMDGLTGEFLNYLPTDSIEEIDLSGCRHMEPHLFISVMKKFKRLRCLTLYHGGFFNNSVAKVIGETKTINDLSMIDLPSDITSSTFNHIANLTNLEELLFNSINHLNDNNLINISNNCKQLKSLSIEYCYSITNNGIGSISKLKKLEILKINCLSKVTDEPIGNLPKTLEILLCYGTNKVNDRGIIKLIQRASNLCRLDLSYCPITNNTIRKAIEVTKKRTNGIILEINVQHTNINLMEITEMSPFLEIHDHDRLNNKRDFID